MPSLPPPPPADEPPPFELNDGDRATLAQTDDEVHLHTWEELRQIIADDELGILKRKPSDLVRYIKWSRETKAAYGSVTNFLCLRRLHWQPLESETGVTFEFKSSTPFMDPDDYRILRNDWPYGLTPDITHLVVWSKSRIPVDAQTGYLTPESNRLIHDFVQTTFVKRLDSVGSGQDRVQWFKNWAKLMSVRGMDHIHVLLRDVPDEMIVEWTGEEASSRQDRLYI